MFNTVKPALIIFILFFHYGNASAGNIIYPPDTPLVSFKNKPVFFLTLDRTSSFVGGKSAATNEIKLGLEFKKKLRLGIGYGKLASDIVVPKTIVSATGKDSSVNAQLYASFFTFNSEYNFYDSKRWQISMPVGLSIGSAYFSYFEKQGSEYFTRKINKDEIVMAGATGIATFRILRWVGLSGGVGYRVALISNSNVKESFNSFVYVFKVRIFLGEIYKTVFPRGITGKHDPPYSNEYWD